MSVRPHPFFSGALFARKSCFVYLPKGYEQSDRRYPVIYLLHGLYGSESHWLLKGGAEQTLDRMMESGQLRPSIVIMPSDGGYSHGTFYIDWYDGSGNFEQYFLYDLIPEIDKMYRTIADPFQRAVAGLSMGGFGAFSLALRNPGLFGAAVSFSGALISQSFIMEQHTTTEASRMIGPPHGPYALAHDLHHCADKRVADAGKPQLYFSCGTSDYLYPLNSAYHEHLTAIGYEHTYEEHPGEHNWAYWSEHLADGLSFIESCFDDYDARD